MRRLLRIAWVWAALFLAFPAFAQEAPAIEIAGEAVVRIKDITRPDGVRSNQLLGLGLVVGLEGTGDGRSSQANVQMVANMLERMGLTVNADELRLRNAAAVMVTAELPPFARPGDLIDVTVSSFGDARSLQGGFLLMTPLQAGNGEVYAVAQGPVSIGGFNVRGAGARVQQNHAAVGRIPGGAIVEREVPMEFVHDDRIRLLLNSPDFTTAARIAEEINRAVAPGAAWASDSGAVEVAIPENFQANPVAFLSLIEELPVRPSAVAKVVINERTGTIVMGHGVRIATVAVTHGSLRVRIEQETEVVQPPSFSQGQTVVSRTSRISAREEPARSTVLQGDTDVAQLVEALNAVGASPREIIGILQAIQAAGALYGELEVI